MKKITLSITAMMFSLLLFSQNPIVLSHSTDQETIIGSVACANQDTGVATVNSFWRSYITSDFDINEDKTVTGVQFAVGSSDFAFDGFSVLVNIYTVDGSFPSGTLNQETGQLVPVAESDAGTILEVQLDEPFVVSSDTEVAIEIFDADETVNFRIGQNENGETAPSYLSSASCSITTPTEIGTGALAAFDDDIIINLVVDDIMSVNDYLLSQVSIYPNPAVDVINVNVPSNVQISGATLYDILGKNTGVSINNGTINVSGLVKGIYMLTIETSAGTLTQKVVKK